VLTEMLALWAGPAYAELADWLPASAEATRLLELRLLAEEQQVEALLVLGRHRDAVPRAAALAESEPLREQRWLVLATALYRSGRQAESLRAIDRARRHLAGELGLDLGQDLVRLEQAVLDHDRSLDVTDPSEPDPTLGAPNPYKGLAPYGEGDHEIFHGRGAELAVCHARLAETGALLVVGRSGHGKSSLVLAGLVPALRAEGRSVVVVRAGDLPPEDPERVLEGQPDDAVLVLDQAEELFTLVEDPVARETLAALIVRRLAGGAVVVVLRADHVGSLALLPDLARALEQSSYVLGPMTEAGLRSAIEDPAREHGCRVEPALTEVLVQEAFGHPGVLPLLSHVLAETWARRDAGSLTLAGYRATGGIQAALSRTADAVHDQLGPADRKVLSDLLLRLVALDEDGEPTRRTLDRRSVAADEPAQRVLTLLVRARLVTAVHGGYVLAHESLVRSWPRLADWLREDAAAAQMLLDLSRSATQWDDDGRHPSGLLRGPRLHLAAALLEERALGIGSLERTFLDASLAADAEDRTALAARAASEQRANRRLRRALAAAGVLVVGIVIAASVAVAGSRDARAARDRAAAAARVALVQDLVSRSSAEDDRSLRALLAVAAYETDDGPGSLDALFSLFTDDPGYEGALHLDAGRPVRAAAFADGGDTLLLADDRADLERVDLRVEADGSVGPRVPVLVAQAQENRADPVLGVAPEAGVVIVAARDTTTTQRGAVVAYDLATGSPIVTERLVDFVPTTVAVSPDGSYAAISGGDVGAVELLDLERGSLQDLELPPPATPVLATDRSAGLAYAGAGRLVVGSEGGRIRVVDASDGRVLDAFDATPRTSEAAVWTDGRSLVTSGADGIERLDLATGRPAWPRPAPLRCLGLVVLVALDQLECSTAGGQVSVVDYATGTVSGTRPTVTAEPLSALVVSADGERLAAIGAETGQVPVWRLDGGGPITQLVPGRFDALAGYEPDGERLLVAVPDRNQIGEVGDVQGDHVLIEPDASVIPAAPDAVLGTTWAARGRLLAVQPDFSLALRDIDTGRDVATAPALDLVATGTSLDTDNGRLVLFDDHGRIRALDTDTLTAEPPSLDLGYRVSSVVAVDAGTVAVIDARGATLLDAESGAERAGPVAGVRRVAVGPDGTLVLGHEDGTVSVVEAERLTGGGPDLPGAYGALRTLEVVGPWLAIQSGDDLAQLVDLRSRRLIGGLLATGGGGPEDVPTLALRPDGLELALRTEDGLTRWTLDPSRWRDAACALAGRGFTAEEAARYEALRPGVSDTCQTD
jgi:WD40 repeat protein